MEKKTKKLQLRKETIAVLNGERMSYVIGGMGTGCQMNGQFYREEEMVNNDENQCVCKNGNWQCQPVDGDSGIRLTIAKSCVNTNCNCWSKAENCNSLQVTECNC